MRHLCALIGNSRLNQRDFAGEKRFRNEKFAVFTVSTSFYHPFSFPSRVIAATGVVTYAAFLTLRALCRRILFLI